MLDSLAMKTLFPSKRPFIAAFFLLLVGGLAEGSTFYTVTDLGPANSVTALNESGQVLGWTDNGSFYYDGSSRYLLPAPPNGSFRGAGLNNRGEIVGTVTSPGSDYSIAVYSNGAYRTVVQGPNASASAINDAGQIAGQELRAYEGALYSGGTITGIGTLPGDFASSTRAIASNGDVLALSQGSTGGHAAIFSNGTLSPVAGSVGLDVFDVTAFNNHGQVVGAVALYGGSLPIEAVLFSGGAAVLLGAFPGSEIQETFASSINDSGVIVGDDIYGVSSTAFIDYSGTGLIDLNSLLINGSGWMLQNANGVNNAGQIAGTGLFDGRKEAFLLSPAANTPEPASAALVLCGVAVAYSVRRYARRVPGQ